VIIISLVGSVDSSFTLSTDENLITFVGLSPCCVTLNHALIALYIVLVWHMFLDFVHHKLQLAVLAGDFLLSRACVALASLKNTEVTCILMTC